MAAAGPHIWSMLDRVLSVLAANLPAALDAIEADATYPDIASGALTDPVIYQVWTPGTAEPKDYPAVLVEVVSSGNEAFVGPQRTTRIILAVHVVGRWGDNPRDADKRAWCYAKAVDDVLHAGLPGGAGFMFLNDVGDDYGVEAWGQDVFGRDAIYRGEILQRTQRSAA